MVHYCYCSLLLSYIIFVFSVRYIYRVDGFVGCFRGLIPRLAEQSVFLIGCTATKYQLQKRKVAFVAPKPRPDGTKAPGFVDYDVLDRNITLTDHFKCVGKDLLCRIAGITVSYPLQVIAIRTMAEFIGRESTYG